MTDLLFRADPYLAEASARITGFTAEGGILLDRTVFYATGGACFRTKLGRLYPLLRC